MGDSWLRQRIDAPDALFRCPLWNPLPPQKPGCCAKCEKPLSGRRSRWCSTECATWLYLERGKNHDWKMARAAALERDGYKCVVCGHDGKADKMVVDRHGHASRYTELEVNHIVPRRGARYSRSCRNHLSNLETVCRACHKQITKRQQIEDRAARESRQILVGSGAIRPRKRRKAY